MAIRRDRNLVLILSSTFLLLTLLQLRPAVAQPNPTSEVPVPSSDKPTVPPPALVPEPKVGVPAPGNGSAAVPVTPPGAVEAGKKGNGAGAGGGGGVAVGNTMKGNNDPWSPAMVANYGQLIRALNQRRPIVIVDTFYLKGPMPNITWTVNITGHPRCRQSELGMCRIDARRRSRHFIVEKGGQLVISNLQLSRGRPISGSGGSIWIMNGGQARLDGVFFRFNGLYGVTTAGGAVEVDEGGALHCHRCHFIRNFAGFGGAVSLAKGAEMTADANVFHRNMASTAGGAVSAIMKATVNLHRSKFNANSAAVGSAVHAFDSSLTLCQASYYNNNASIPGSVFLASSSSAVTACNLHKDSLVLETGSTLSNTACTTTCGSSKGTLGKHSRLSPAMAAAPSSQASQPPMVSAADVAKEFKEQVELLQDQDAGKAAAAAAAVMILATREQALLLLPSAVPPLISLLTTSSDIHVRRNALAALTALMSRSQNLHSTVASTPGIGPLVVGALKEEVGLRINAAAFLSNLAQDAEGVSVITSSASQEALVTALQATDNTDQSREALVDAMCAIASSSKEAAALLVAKGALEPVAALLPAPHSAEVHVRALIAIAVLLPASPDAPSRLASVQGALPSLPALARSSDQDVRVIAADLFTTIAKHTELRPLLEQQLRAK
ncbi:unnamed protein product [Closterium sp. Yama58-4]|nr:unnamed protein product [Closterium sp. Yama58-4]